MRSPDESPHPPPDPPAGFLAVPASEYAAPLLGELAARQRESRTALPAMLDAALRGRYAIEREIGHGGMAIVFLAEDLRWGLRVAIKVMRPEFARGVGTVRFLREIALAAQLRHPRILPLLDSGEVEGLPFHVMPFVEGASLRARIAREGELPIDDALRITRDVADALDHAHRSGILHRDIKPENILIGEDGHALVADFGIARAIVRTGDDWITGTGTAIGTPAYMSPEQAAGASDVDGRSDVFALGCVLYEMLAGRPPYTGPTKLAVRTRAIAGRVTDVRRLRASVPEHVAAALRRALARAPADRFATAGELAEALNGVPSGARASTVRVAITRAGSAIAAWFGRLG